MATIEQRTSKDGVVTFRAQIRLKGAPSQSATFVRRTDARRWIQDIESAIRDGRYFKTAEARRHTVSKMIDRYISDVLPGRRSAVVYESQLRWWKREIGDYVLADLTPANIIQSRDKLRKHCGPATCNRYLAALSHCCTIAMKEWQWLEDNPVRRISRYSEPPGRSRFLDDDERGKLLDACRASIQPCLYPVVVLALSTGMRRGEIMNLTWACVDLRNRTVRIEKTKNGERRLVPLVGQAFEAMQTLSKIRRLDTVLVFAGRDPSKPVDLTEAWITALKRAAITGFRFHDLRHSAASYLAMSGATPSEIAAVLGHKTLDMVKRYAHVADAHIATVVERMNRSVLMEGARDGMA